MVGIAEASFLLAMSLGHRFGIVSTVDRATPATWDLLRHYGIEARCAAVEPSEAEVLELDDDPAGALDRIEAAGARAIAAGAEVLCMGCGAMVSIRDRAGTAAARPGRRGRAGRRRPRGVAALARPLDVQGALVRAPGDDPAVTAARVEERLDALYRIGGGEGANRPALSEHEDAAHALVAGWMREAGLETGTDAIGNLYGRLPGREPGLAEIWCGSHLDSVPRGGRFDGALGVVAAPRGRVAARIRGRAP